MIEAEGLGRRFGGLVAVENVSLRVPDGAILALLGPNGAGKTTIVRMLTGVLGLTVGEARVAGFDVRREPAAVRARIGLVTDAPGLHEQMTAPGYLDFFGSIYGLSREDRARRIDELLALFELDAHRAERMAGFSKGMKQKVALARALLHQPAALFLDEPTSGLDPLSARTVRDLIVGMKQANRSIILCTHDLDEAERLADEVAILRRGRIVARDRAGALRALASTQTAVRVLLAEPCPAALDAIRGVSDLATPPRWSPDPMAPPLTLLEYSTAYPSEVNPRVIERLVVAGARIVSVSCVTPSLEDAYAAAVGRSEEVATA